MKFNVLYLAGVLQALCCGISIAQGRIIASVLMFVMCTTAFYLGYLSEQPTKEK